MAKARSLPYLDAHVPNRENARLVIAARLAELYSWEVYVADPTHVKELHNLRIAAKRLRYSFEVFEDALGQESIPLREEVEKIQAELGALHDSDVLAMLLHLCLIPGSSERQDGEGIALTTLQELHREDLDLPQELLAFLLDPQTLPSAEERHGLEMLLYDIEHEREKQYRAFLEHWEHLQEHHYRQQVLALLA